MESINKFFSEACLKVYALVKSHMRTDLKIPKKLISKLGIISCVFQAGNNFVNLLIPLKGVLKRVPFIGVERAYLDFLRVHHLINSADRVIAGTATVDLIGVKQP